MAHDIKRLYKITIKKFYHYFTMSIGLDLIECIRLINQ